MMRQPIGLPHAESFFLPRLATERLSARHGASGRSTVGAASRRGEYTLRRRVARSRALTRPPGQGAPCVFTCVYVASVCVSLSVYVARASGELPASGK